MTRLIVDLETETILNMDNCVILDTDTLDDDALALLQDCDEDMGFDDDIVCQVADANGHRIKTMYDLYRTEVA